MNQTRSSRWRTLALSIFLVGIVGIPSVASAMPMFSRKHKMPCAGCHDPALPRLNDVGYKFRRAGFRMPEQIGQEEVADFDLGNYLSGRIQSRYTLAHTSDNTVSPGTSSTSNTFEMREITLYPITGSFMKHWATETEISLAPDELTEIENAYLRGVWGNQNLWFEARAGLWHPFEGFGGSDRPLGVSRPLFETQGAQHNQDTLFRIWGIDQVGLEAGLQWKNTSLSLSVHNGVQTEVEKGKVVGVGITADQDQRKDLLVFANQILGTRSGISGYWAHGSVSLPTDVAGFIAGNSADTFRDDYDRLALFASVGVGRFTALAGGALGWDDARDPVTGDTSRFRSQGAFVEGDVALGGHFVGFARLDYFDPSTAKGSNQKLGATIGASVYNDWVFLVPELQLRSTADVLGDKVDTTALLHAVVIY